MSNNSQPDFTAMLVEMTEPTKAESLSPIKSTTKRPASTLDSDNEIPSEYRRNTMSKYHMQRKPNTSRKQTLTDWCTSKPGTLKSTRPREHALLAYSTELSHTSVKTRLSSPPCTKSASKPHRNYSNWWSNNTKQTSRRTHKQSTSCRAASQAKQVATKLWNQQLTDLKLDLKNLVLSQNQTL